MGIMQQENKYYNYILLDPRKPFTWEFNSIKFEYLPFYVGKGSGTRCTDHYRSGNIRCDSNPHKKNLLLKLKQGGYFPKFVILNTNSSESDALNNEIYIISWIKQNLGDVLTNITEGGENPPVRYGVNNNKSVKVYQYNKDTGEFIQEYECIREACKALNISLDNACHISECCKNKRRTCAFFIWRYEKLDKITPDPKKFGRIKFDHLIAYNSTEKHIFNSMKEAYDFLEIPNKGKINQVIKGKRKMYMGYFWKIE